VGDGDRDRNPAGIVAETEGGGPTDGIPDRPVPSPVYSVHLRLGVLAEQAGQHVLQLGPALPAVLDRLGGVIGIEAEGGIRPDHGFSPPAPAPGSRPGAPSDPTP